jgi:hypothetical protein
MLLAAVAWFAQHLDWLNELSLRRMLAMAAFSIFPLLMSWEAVAAIDRLRGSPLRGIWRVLAFAGFATAPGIWHAVLLYGHIEEPIALWLTLLTIRLLAEGRPRWAGLAMGLALLTRTSILVPCLVLLIVLVLRRRIRPAFWFGSVTALTAALGILPFMLADERDVIYSLITFRGSLTIGGGSFWYLVLGTPLETIGTRYDSWIILGAAALIAILLLALRRGITVAHRDLYALLVLTGLCFPLLIKTTWPYYFLDLYIFMGIWWLGDAHGWDTLARWLGVLVPAFLLVCEAVSDYGTTVQIDGAAMRTESLAISIMEMGFILAIGAYLVVRKPPPINESGASHQTGAVAASHPAAPNG